MDDKLIIEALANAVKNGEMALDQVPEIYKEQVKAKLGDGE